MAIEPKKFFSESNIEDKKGEKSGEVSPINTVSEKSSGEPEATEQDEHTNRDCEE